MLEPPEFENPPLPADPPDYDPFRDEGGVPGLEEDPNIPALEGGPNIGWAATFPSDPLSVTVFGGQVVVCTNGGTVHALSSTSGRELWHAAVGGPVTGAPAMADGNLVVGTSLGALVSLDPTNGQRKRVETGDAAYLFPLVSGPEQLVAMTDGSSLEIHDAASLRLLGRAQVYGEVTAPPVIGGELVLVATSQGSVVAYQVENGVQAWSARLSGQISAPITVLAGFPSVAIVGTSLGSVVGLDLATGHELWSHQAVGAFVGSAIQQGRLLLAFKGNSLSELNPVTGKLKNTAVISSNPVAAPVFTPAGVAIFLSGGRVDLLRPDLTRTDRVQLPGPIVGQPVGQSTRIYAALRESAVYCLKFPEA
ncbi:MAG: PQQ-binding-like beta-propeller repeat protein [Planctomycetota bacterium]